MGGSNNRDNSEVIWRLCNPDLICCTLFHFGNAQGIGTDDSDADDDQWSNCSATKGPFINYVTQKGGGGGLNNCDGL